MSRSLLHLVLHHAEGFASPLAEPDSELLARFVRSRDEAAFAELLRRHASMVWAVCRQSLGADADAEDAFQATFLALIRSAKTVKDGRALAGWLHGVAVRVALKRKRSAARQRLRERVVAVKETDRPVPEAAWNALLAAVHEEVQRLPDALRTAFVLCELEGVRQTEAAERLGWKPGTLTGRLTRARQTLVERLARRGLAPAVGGSLGLGVATATADAPHRLIDTVMSLIPAGGAVSPALVKLASEGLPMVMRTKLAAAVLIVAGGLSAVLYPMANAQVREAPSTGVGSALPPAPPTPAPPNVPPGPQHAVAAPPTPTITAAATVRHTQWEYKFVVGGFDAPRVLDLLTNMGNDGWEYCGSFPIDKDNMKATKIQHPDNLEVVSWKSGTALIFKRPKGGIPSGRMAKPVMTMGIPPRPAVPAPIDTPHPQHSAPAPIDTPQPQQQPLSMVKLRNAEAAEVAKILKDVFGNAAREITPASRINALIIRTDDKTLKEIKELVEVLDQPGPVPPALPGAGVPAGIPGQAGTSY